jgi:Ni,Fe-hydrogenase III small subunit
MEIAQAFGPVYDAAQYGVHLVASPRHADGLLVTGTPTLNMRQPLERVRDAVPRPALVIACGDCALGRGPYAEAYAVTGAISEHLTVHAEIAGCPPHPDDIVRVLREISGR